MEHRRFNSRLSPVKQRIIRCKIKKRFVPKGKITRELQFAQLESGRADDYEKRYYLIKNTLATLEKQGARLQQHAGHFLRLASAAKLPKSPKVLLQMFFREIVLEKKSIQNVIGSLCLPRGQV